MDQERVVRDGQPTGPWLVTADRSPIRRRWDCGWTVNGERRQTGDIINTGTPPGVAMGQREPRYLRAGDVVELGIDGLGRQRQECVAAP